MGTEQVDPIDHYEQHSDVYDTIHEQVRSTADGFARASRETQEMVLEQAVAFALISVETEVELHERGYLNVLPLLRSDEPLDLSDVEQALLRAGVNYYNNKARYIVHNHSEPNTDAVLDHYDDYVAGDDDAIHRMHRAIHDEYMGVGLRKAGFALAMAVEPEKMCIDRHVARMAGIDPDDVYEGVVVDKYERQCDEIREAWSELTESLSSFMTQWLVFDTDLNGVTTHDSWWLSLPDEVQPEQV